VPLLVEPARADDLELAVFLRLTAPPRVPTPDCLAAEASLLEFARQAWHVVEPSTPFIPGWHIDAICEHLEAVSDGRIRNLLINMPPRHMKSLLVSVFWPAWEWAIPPERRWLYASYAGSLSTRDSLKCRRLIESPWYQGHWGRHYRLTSDQNVKTRFENDRTGYRLATSVGGSATGEGGDRIVCDDPHSVQEAESEAIRSATLTWWDEVMSTRLNDPKTGSRVIVMQRVHESDLSGHVLAQGGYEHLCLPAEYEPQVSIETSIGWRDPRTVEGELLWPARFGADELADLKVRLGSYAAAGQLQQRPSPAEGGTIQRKWWRYYTVAPAQLDRIIQSWDMAFKDLKGNDFVVGQVWGKVGAECYLLDQVRGRMDFPTTVQAVVGLKAKWPRTGAILVEDKANGTAVVATLKHRIPGLIAVNPEGGKQARAAAVAPFIEAGNVHIPDPSVEHRHPTSGERLDVSWVGGYVEEHAQFPNGAHDDQVDGTSQALLRLLVPTEPRPMGALSYGAVSMGRSR
jgi:predicted phage terminase large subunit-like protein